MFASSPQCKNEYISPEMAEDVASLLEKAGALSVHIGGGEPFLNFVALCNLIAALNRHSVGVDYIETNAYWCNDEDFVRERLMMLKKLGVRTVMVSVDPFHIEYIPLERPLKLCTLLDECGFEYFIWQQKFLKRLMALDITKTHTKEELSQALGSEYISETALEYGLGINGRALSFAEKLYPRHPAEFFATDEECPSLTHPHHCHIDLYGNAIPSRCTGICAKAEHYLSTDIDEETYPVLSRLIKGGTKALFEYALQKGFVPQEKGYPTRCALCFAMREYLEREHPSADLAPADFYNQMRKALNSADN